MKILLVGHACSPRQGSEPSLTWNWAWHLSRHHEVWVLAYPHDREGVEEWLARHPNPRAHFIWVVPPQWYDPLKLFRRKGSIHLHYLLWQREVLRQALNLHAKHVFDIVHHVSWGTVSAPPLLWKLPVPIVWGPVGGGQIAPQGFGRYFGSDWTAERIRRLRINFCTQTSGFRNAVARSALILATNRETAAIFETAGAGSKLKALPDSGVTSAFLPERPIIRPGTKTLSLLWVGKLDCRKGLQLALEALARVKDLPVTLQVAGDGSQRAGAESLTQKLGLGDKVQFLGHVPWNEMPRLYRHADAFIFTSLRDSFGTQVLEAMAHSLPIVTLNHQGVGAFVPQDAGIKVAVTTPEDTVAQLAQGIRMIHQSPETRHKMGEKAWGFAGTQTWERRAQQMCEWYEQIVRAAPKAEFGQAA